MSDKARLNRGMFSAATIEWATPQNFFDMLNAEFGFKIDPCSTAENAKCPIFYTEKEDGLNQIWDQTTFMNPPYKRGGKDGDGVDRWVEKAVRECEDNGVTVVCLLPARTCSSWWHSYCMRSSEVRFIRGRLRFGGSEINAPFPSAVVVFRPSQTRPVFSSILRVL